MIDEKKLIEHLQKYCGKQPYLVSENIWDIIRNQPKIGGWIPCSERLPETRSNILICQRSGYVSIGYYSQEKFLDLNSYPFDDVIAWQPLPAPYEVKSDE